MTKLSVVIGTVGQAPLVNCCIEELRRRATMDLEIVLVDNGSTEHESALLRGLAVDMIVYAAHPLGYARAYNAGIAASSGEYVLLLNNDAWPTQRGWDARLVSVLEAVPDAMLVAPMASRVTFLAQRADGPEAADCKLRSTGRVAFVAVLLRRSTLDALGPLDERFVMGAYEDDDYCERILRAGGLIVVDPATFFFHVSGVTMQEHYNDVLPVNRRLFDEKWKGLDTAAYSTGGEATMTHDAEVKDA
ncbi:MAG TPA: glycosyltransferase [Anaerolineae bacterium]|nr:glycosyltransferase [Anaerolineae bacterium]